MYSLSSTSQRGGGHRFVEEVDDDEAAEPPPVPKRREHRHHSSGHKKKKKGHRHRNHHHSHKSDARTPLAYERKNMKVPDDRSSLARGSIFDVDSLIAPERKNEKVRDDSPSKGTFVKDVAPRDHRALPSAATISAAAASSFHEQKAARIPLAPRESKTVKFLDDGNSTKGASEKEFIARYNQKDPPSAAGRGVVTASLQKHAAPALDRAFASAGGVGVATFMEEKEPVGDKEETVLTGPARKVGAVAVPGRLAENEYRVSMDFESDTVGKRNKKEMESEEEMRTGEEEEEKCEIEATAESVANLSSGLTCIAANEPEPTSPQSSATTPIMDPISSQQPGAFRIAGFDGETSELDSVVMEESMAPTILTTPSRKLVEAWKVNEEPDLEAQVQQRLTEVLRNAPVAQVGELPAAQQQQREEKSRKRQLIVAVVVLLAVLAAIGITLGVLLPTDDTDEGSPDQLINRNSLTKQVANISRTISGDVIDDAKSPQYAAREWVISDASEKHPSDTGILSDGHRREIEIRYVAALLHFSMDVEKNWTDSYNFLSQEHVCTWRNDTVARGIGCDGKDQIISLILRENNLNGTIPSEIGVLTTLTLIDLSGNKLNNTIPNELITLPGLRDVMLSQNELSGQIPISIKDATELEQLWLTSNRLTGNMHDSLGRSTTLRSLRLDRNELTGNIPDFAWQSPLEELFLSFNNFGVVGSIPRSLERLSNLTALSLANNTFTGTIPLFLQTLTNLRVLRLGSNVFTGPIPSEIGLLTNIEFLSLGNNKLTGKIPSEIGLLTDLELFSFSGNQFTGGIPSEIGVISDDLSALIAAASFDGGAALQDLSSPQSEALFWLSNNANLDHYTDARKIQRYALAVLYFSTNGPNWLKSYNWLDDRDECEWKQEDPGSVKPFGINCNSDNMVASLRLIRNRLEGSIPREIGYFSNLNNLDLVNNTIRGSLDTLENLTRLENLRLAANQLTGTIPEFLYSHPVLSQLYLDDNRLEGTISSLLGTSTSLKYFWAEGNELVGEIPKALGQTSVLQSIDLGSNRITGSIPEFTTSSLIHLWLASNNLEGPIPTSIGTLSSLKTINLAFNSLAGTIPTELQGCTSLGFMNFQGNHLSGNLGAALDSFPRILESFDVTENQLTGTMPTLIGEFSSLEWFDVGYNKLVGTIPTEVGSLSQLETFYIGHNKISGVIPTSIGMLSKLTFFGIGDNSVVGTLPSEFGLLVELTILGLEYNNLSGVVPTTLANLSKLTKVRLQGNNFTGSVNSLCNSGADFVIFAANTCSDPKQLKCHCCTHCCDPDADQCELI